MSRMRTLSNRELAESYEGQAGALVRRAGRLMKRGAPEWDVKEAAALTREAAEKFTQARVYREAAATELLVAFAKS